LRAIRFVPLRIGFETCLVGPAVLLGGVLVWLWPIGIGGGMPVGGDVTQFFLGLMAFYGDSLGDGRLPVWNDLWGYGFPGLAESQMGVFYPVHLVLYRWLNTETAYVVSLLAHTLWGGMGAYWAARQLGTSRMGSTLASFCWTTCGFFLVHLAHPWGYTTGCWMPWAWGLGFNVIAGGGVGTGAKIVYPILLALVLALQLLPGHFQLAFITECGLVLMVVWVVIERFCSGVFSARREPESSSGRLSLLGALIVLFALGFAFLLAAVQLVPTARLALLAGPQGEFKYLSDFASPPFHLVNYVAPGLFHRSPLWRPLVWDPFHAMPEEHLTYVGLVPLFLACMTAVREWRRDASVRFLCVVAVATLLLGLGPYVPGFRYLIMVPGFSFFRAPSRWSVAAGLALALLAGKGVDRWGEWVRPGRSLRRLAVGAVCWVGVTLAVIELALFCTGQPGWPQVAGGFQRVFSSLPWPGEASFATVLAQARRPQVDQRIGSALAQTILLRKTASERIFTEQRLDIYVRELGEAVPLLVLVLLLAMMSDKAGLAPLRARRALLLLTFLDLWLLGRHRLVDVAPLQPLAERSPVLASLARQPRGTRIADRRTRNMPMRVGLAPISAYRTLDLPVVGSLTTLATWPLADPRIAKEVQAALRATGSGVRLFDPVENREDEVLKRPTIDRETIDDPVLASLLFGESWAAEQGPWVRKFSIWRPEAPAARVWFVPGLDSNEAAILDDWSGDPRHILRILQDATPLPAESRTPEEWTIPIEATEPGWVIVTQVADPQWRAHWINPDGFSKTKCEIGRAFRTATETTGWQCIAVPDAGRWTLRLEYEGGDVLVGLMISVIAWSGWVTVMLRSGIEVWRSAARTMRNAREGCSDDQDWRGARGRLGLRGARADSNTAGPSSCRAHGCDFAQRRRAPPGRVASEPRPSNDAQVRAL
jgi:hypothetical protein